MISKKTVKRWYYVAVIVGLMIAAALIIILNQQIMIAACAEHGGRYIAEQSLCIDSVTQYKHPLKPTPVMLIGYALLVLIIPLLGKRLVDALVSKYNKND